MATSPQPADPPLSVEPVIGWRIWRLQRIGGVLTLASVTRSDTWPANERMEARCANHHGTTIPSQGCMCGLYAAATPEDLARSGMLNPSTCVVGAIAMWGTVVEHQRGARSRFAYPSRLRLVCGRCLHAGVGAVDPTSVIDEGGPLTAACARHSRGIAGPSWPADQVRSELLSTYGVDLIPIERIARSLRTGSASRSSNAPEPLKVAALAIWSLVKLVLGGLFMLWAYSGLILLALALVAGALQLVTKALGLRPADAATSPIALTPVTATRVVVPSRDDLPNRGTPSPPRPASAFVCGVGEGDTVSIVPCDIPRDLMGFAERSTPKGAAHDCIGGWDAYSRGNNYWICWTDFWPPPSVHPWASAPNPWSIPVEEGGAIHEHR